MALGISVIVCCYNSADRLPETLKHLAQQKVPDDVNWEVIVVDNASTDDTYEQARSAWERYNLTEISFQAVKQVIPGLINARKMGISLSKYDFLLFCDDDNRLCDTYVTTAFNIMQADPQIGALGGCGILEAEQPAWSEIEDYKNSYIVGPQTWAATDHWVYGAGCIYRKSIFLNAIKIGWQQITTGRTGATLTSGEDVEICFMIYLAGYKIIADERLTFQHFVPVKRQNPDYILRLIYWQAYSYVLLSGYTMLIDHAKSTLAEKLNRTLILSTKALILSAIKFNRQRLFTKSPITFGQRAALRSYSGTIYSILKNRKKLIDHYTIMKDHNFTGL